MIDKILEAIVGTVVSTALVYFIGQKTDLKRNFDEHQFAGTVLISGILALLIGATLLLTYDRLYWNESANERVTEQAPMTNPFSI